MRRRPIYLLAGCLAVLVLAACTSTASPTAGSNTAAASSASGTTGSPSTSTSAPATTATSTVTASTTAGAATVSSSAMTPTSTASTGSGLITELPPFIAGQDVSPAQIDAAIAKVDGLATALMKRSGIPGLAVAVVHNGKLAFAHGYGVRKVGTPGNVDADTVFQLASVSKPIGATVVAHEITEGTVGWDTPIVKYLPNFSLADPWVTSHTTIGDMYAHRSGLPPHAGDLLEDLGYSQAQILQRLHVLSLAPFRTSYAYTNFGLTAGAEAVAAAAKTPWTELSKKALYAPLGMTSTSSSFADYAASPERAWTHMKVGSTWQAKTVRDPDQQTPAGGVSSSVNDLAKWLIMVLGDGTGAGGVKIASPEALDPAISAQIVSSAFPPVGRSGFYGYGFDVSYQTSGRTQFSHSGAFSAGAGTSILMLPSLNIGIVTLTNAMPIGVAETLNQQFADLVQYGAPKFDWYGIYNPALTAMGAPFGEYAGKTPPANPTPAASLAAYVGSYSNGWVGPVQIRVRGTGLQLTIGPRNATYPLIHWDGDTFTYRPTGESANPGSVSWIKFRRAGGKPASELTIEFYQQDDQGRLIRT